ncbi:MAG: OmpH family outer membrane protein [Bacteroidales bacterium]|nr:OmpH family outer membrane protein [Bacteroidales bacterium]
MKINFNLILNVILFIGLVILYFFHFSDNNKNEKLHNPPIIANTASGSLSIAFVNSDVFLEKYELVNQLKKELDKQGKKMEAEILSKQQAYEKDAVYFQEQVAKNALSEESAQIIYKQLMQEQDKLIELRDKYTNEIYKKENDMNILLLDSITNFLKRYNKILNFDYILSYNKAGNILFAKDTLDITESVLYELNKEYKEKNPVKN